MRTYGGPPHVSYDGASEATQAADDAKTFDATPDSDSDDVFHVFDAYGAPPIEIEDATNDPGSDAP
jgi:hypothetical protein